MRGTSPIIGAWSMSIRDRLWDRGKVPAGARVVSPARGPSRGARPAGERAWVAATCQPTENLAADFWRRPSVRDSSAILMLGDRAIGGMVAEAFGELADVPWRSVDPEFRGGWANVVLSAALGDRLAALGVRRVRFSTTEETPDTENGVRIHGYLHRRIVDAPPARPP